MRYTTLGHSGIEVSRLCLGGMSFGEASPDFHQWTIGPDDTRAVIARALDALVRAGKVRALGASEMYAYQLHNLQVIAEQNGWTTFTSMQCHYNLLYREDEREMIPVCRQYDMALTPYSPMASGHLCRPTWDCDSKRSTTDTTMVNKHDRDRAIDTPIIERVAKVATNHGVPMAQVALAWHWARGVESPIVGCSSPARVDDAVAALDVMLSPDELDFIEDPYQRTRSWDPRADRARSPSPAPRT